MLRQQPPDGMLFALLGGLLAGTGAGVATGCMVGNMMSGWAWMSVGMIVFGLVTIASNRLRTCIYLMGGNSQGSSDPQDRDRKKLIWRLTWLKGIYCRR